MKRWEPDWLAWLDVAGMLLFFLVLGVLFLSTAVVWATIVAGASLLWDWAAGALPSPLSFLPLLPYAP